MNSAEQKKIVLVVAESIDVEDSSGSKANVALIQNLKAAGFEVVVYHYTRKRMELPGIRSIEIKERKANFLYFLSRTQRKIQYALNVNLAKHLEPRFGFSFTFFNDSNSIKEALKALKIRPHLILTLSKGASFRPHHALLGLPDLHSKWIAYIHDPYPFHFYPEPYTWSEPGFEHKVKFFREVSRKCSWAVFPSLLLREWMEHKYADFKGKGLVIPHQIREPKSTSAIVPEFFDPRRFNILHAGNLMKQRPPFYLIEAFKRFLEKNPAAASNSHLILVGNASYHEKYLSTVEKKLPQLIVSKDSLPFNQVQEMQRQTSVNIILESIADQSPFLPGKFPHCIAAEKPILLLGPKISEAKRLLGGNYIYWSELNDIEAISVLIERLYKQWLNRRGNLSMKRKDLNYYLSQHHLKDQIFKILED